MNPAGIKTSSQLFVVQKLSGAISIIRSVPQASSHERVKLKEQFDGKLMIVDSYSCVYTDLNICHLFLISH